MMNEQPSMKDLAPLHALLASRYPQLMKEEKTPLLSAEAMYWQLVLAHSKDEGAPDASRMQWLAEVTLAQLMRLLAVFGGGQPYFPSIKTFEATDRNLRMVADFRDSNYAQLARKYKLSDVQVRSIVDGWRRQEYERRQGKLPGLD
jgi:Mor family transcriptional regulator